MADLPRAGNKLGPATITNSTSEGSKPLNLGTPPAGALEGGGFQRVSTRELKPLRRILSLASHPRTPKDRNPEAFRESYPRVNGLQWDIMEMKLSTQSLEARAF